MHSSTSGFSVVTTAPAPAGFVATNLGLNLKSLPSQSTASTSNSVIHGRPALRTVSGGVGYDHYPMLKSMYEQQQQTQAAALMAAQQGLQALLSPANSSGSNTSNNQQQNNNNSNIDCSSSSSNNNNNNSYPHAMDCDPPPHQMPPPPLPAQAQRYSGVSKSTGANNGAQTRQRNNYVKPPHAHTHAPLQHHSFAPTSLPIDLVHHHSLSSAATHLMMTDPSVISASASGSVSGPPSYTSMLYHQQPAHALQLIQPPPPTQHGFMLAKPNTVPTSSHHLGDMPAQLAHRRASGRSGIDAVDGARQPNVSTGGNIDAVGGGGGGGGGDADDTSSPMKGVCVQQSPVVIH